MTVEEVLEKARIAGAWRVCVELPDGITSTIYFKRPERALVPTMEVAEEARRFENAILRRVVEWKGFTKDNLPDKAVLVPTIPRDGLLGLTDIWRWEFGQQISATMLSKRLKIQQRSGRLVFLVQTHTAKLRGWRVSSDAIRDFVTA